MSKQVIIPSQTAQAVQNFSLHRTIESFRKQWEQAKKEAYASDAYKTYDQAKHTMEIQVCTPVTQAWKHSYEQLPLQTTKLKFNFLKDYQFKERFIFLNILAFGGALLSMRRINRYNAWGVCFGALKNATLTYIFGGLMVAPEIYNPLMKQ